MKSLRNLFILLLSIALNFISSLTWSQDSTRYCQENGVLFSNCYELIKADKSLKHGTFTQRTSTNDGQVFYGWGSFKESRSSIELTYSKVNTYPIIKYKNARLYSDTLVIQWFSRDNAQEFFRIHYEDATVSKTYKSNWEQAVLKIPKDELKNNRLELYQGPNKILDFTVNSSRTDFITIYAEDPHSLYLQKHKEKLHKTGLGFTTKGVNTNDKKSNFLKIK